MRNNIIIRTANDTNLNKNQFSSGSTKVAHVVVYVVVYVAVHDSKRNYNKYQLLNVLSSTNVNNKMYYAIDNVSKDHK
jgi:hypothetical protein